MARRATIWLTLVGVLTATPAAAHGHGAVYVGSLSGTQELPPNDSLGTGFAIVSIDFDLFTMRVQLDFAGLSGETTTAHIHGPTFPALGGTADAATTEPSFPGFPTGATAGEYDHTLDLTAAASYSPAFLGRFRGSISLASNALFAGLDEGRMFLNIHTTAFPGGEIRGFLQATPASDFSHNGVVDAGDLDLWRQAFFATDNADADQDSLTTGNDFLRWQRELGSVARVGAHQHGVSPVPEPSSGAPFACLAVTALCSCRASARVRKSGEKYPEMSCMAVVARPSYRSLSRLQLI
jgi:hypothetical protein